jgi:LacI family gluconate utilization system Gnt-I transcriptional repressor
LSILNLILARARIIFSFLPSQIVTTTPASKNNNRRNSASSHRMEDVATLAGVSMITVSRVINSPDKVAEVTRIKVEKAIRTLGYVPNLMAGSLASSKSRLIGAIVPTIDNSIFAETIRGLSQTLALNGYELLLGQTGYVDNAEERIVSTFLGRRVDAMVLTGIRHTDKTRSQLRDSGIPVVETWDLSDRPIDMLAGFSNLEAGAAMGRYLISKGYMRLGFAGGDESRALSRLAGLTATVKSTPGANLRHVLLKPASSSFKAGREALVQLLKKDPNLQAIFFSNDALAVGAMMECVRRGLRVPQDIAIAGFADLDIASEILPALTTVQVRSRRIGETAAGMLMDRLQGREVPDSVKNLGFSIISRESA